MHRIRGPMSGRGRRRPSDRPGAPGVSAPLAPPVLLVHGLWTNRAVMLYLAHRLAAAGFAPRSVGYLSALRDFAHNAARVGRMIAETPGPSVHIVAHSLGGLVTLAALAHAPDERVRRVVLLGVPIADSLSGALIARSRLAPLLGTTRALWLSHPRPDIPADVEAGAIAGTRRFGLGRVVLDLPPPNDGVVTVAETRHASVRTG